MSRREWIQRAETAWIRRLAIHERRGLLRGVMLAATRLADGWGLALLIPLALVLGGRAQGLAAIGLGTASAITIALVVHLIKSLVKRSRPAGIELSRPIAAPDRHAFPSGHAAQAFGMILVTWTVSPLLALVTAVVALLVALSRVFFCLHYPSDVVVGGLLGLTVSWTILWVGEHSGYVDWLRGLGGG